jgi:hypothetical protein
MKFGLNLPETGICRPMSLTVLDVLNDSRVELCSRLTLRRKHESFGGEDFRALNASSRSRAAFMSAFFSLRAKRARNETSEAMINARL